MVGGQNAFFPLPLQVEARQADRLSLTRGVIDKKGGARRASVATVLPEVRFECRPQRTNR